MKNDKKLFGFPSTFWIANSMELFERWAYYGMFTVLSIYLTDPVSKGGLGFSQEQRGIMQAIVTGILYLLPILGGAIADKLGFRKVLLTAFVTLTASYYAMGQFNSYGGVFTAFLFVAVGAAIFKPIIVATVSKTSPKGKDTVGFGIFYMIVNVGSWIGPIVASKLRALDWTYVFIMCAIAIAVNLLLLLLYKEPEKDLVAEKESLGKTLSKIFQNTAIVLKDSKFVVFMLIMVGFWILYMQLFFTMPVYITQWVDTRDIYAFLNSVSPALSGFFGTVVEGEGVVLPEMIMNMAAFTIIFTQVIISHSIRKIHPVKSISAGTVIIALALGQMGMQSMGMMIVLGVIILAFGEMISSPRIQEYISRIAPKDKVALYMGYSFLPVAGGNLIGGLLSGSLYGSMSDKYYFVKQELVNRGLANWDQLKEMDGGLAFEKAKSLLSLDPYELNQLLRETYHHGSIWLVFAGIGIATAIILIIYNKFMLKSN